METDTNLPGDKASEVSDEMRLDASTRLRTLEPLHGDVTANEVPEEVLVSQNILQGPIANISNDSESTAAFVSKDTHTVLAKNINPAIAIVGLLIVIAAGAAAIMLLIK